MPVTEGNSKEALNPAWGGGGGRQEGFLEEVMI